MQATFPAFRLNLNALFYMGLFALLAFFLLAPPARIRLRGHRRLSAV